MSYGPGTFKRREIMSLACIIPTRQVVDPTRLEPAIPSLELNFPRIAAEISRLWGWGQCEPYLSSLILNERPDRHGFDPEVMDELMMLHGVRWHLSHLSSEGPLARDGEFNFVANHATH
jgi:hypothetical protein